jgi:hypothetical protein
MALANKTIPPHPTPPQPRPRPPSRVRTCSRANRVSSVGSRRQLEIGWLHWQSLCYSRAVRNETRAASATCSPWNPGAGEEGPAGGLAGSGPRLKGMFTLWDGSFRMQSRVTSSFEALFTFVIGLLRLVWLYSWENEAHSCRWIIAHNYALYVSNSMNLPTTALG